MVRHNARYLKVTMHDNDFTNSLMHLGNTLYRIFLREERFPEEDELPLLKEYVKSLWYAIDNIESIMRWNKKSVGFKANPEAIFTPQLEFVDYLDISDYNDDSDSIYIPMFANADVLVR